MTQTLRYLLLLEGVGLAGVPLAGRALGRLPGAGWAFGRVLALVLWTWLVWFAGSLGVPNGLALAIAGAAVVAGGGAVLWRTGAPRDRDPFRRRLWLACEGLFVAAFLVAALYVAFAPDVWGTERPMDMALTNATLTSGSFPPHDPWMSGESLNYYYLGQLMVGLLIRLTGVEPSAGYNLGLATVFALVVTTAFALAATLAEAARRQGLPVRFPLLAGAAAVVLVAVMGDLRGGWQALHVSGSLSGFDWFSATRVIPNTINEFPYASFAVGDLHAHLLAVPLTFLAVAFVVQLALCGPARPVSPETFAAAVAIGILYAVNSWSWPVAAGLVALGVLVAPSWRAAVWGAVVLVAGLVLVLPFIVHFNPNSRGLGLVSEAEREAFGAFLGHHLVIEGTLLWLLVAPLAGRLRASRHRWRVVVWGTAGLVVVLSLLAGARLAGFAIAAALALVALHAALRGPGGPAERVLWALLAVGLACIAAPELVYVRDEFDGTRYVRMNTVFKMGYQAWLLLAVGGGVALSLARGWLPGRLRVAWQVMAAALVAVSLAYTVAAADARDGGFADSPSLDGRTWLNRTAPGDIPAIDWIRANTPGSAVVLEAVGEDYSAFGNGRISVYTGRPTVMGWQGHELQWSHQPGPRADDVRTLYRTRDPVVARSLVRRYRISYAVVGPLEHTTYGDPGALVRIGRLVFQRAGTAVYDVRSG